MRLLSLLILILPLTLAQQRRTAPTTAALPAPEVTPVKPEERCSVEGTLYNAATGEPVRKASVTMRRAEQGRGPGGMGSMTYAATSDAGGRYSITGIEPGRYRLSVEKAGFVDQQYGAKGPNLPGSPLTLEKSQRATDISLKLTPQGVIAGRVLDEDGDPVANATLQVLRRTYVRGRKQLVPVDNASTNDLGEYRVYGLPPGRYFVSATYRRGFRGAPLQDSSQEAFAPTYYPAGATPEMAAPVEVAPGAQFRGIDIRMRKTQIVQVAGRVTGGGAAQGGRGTNIMLVPKDNTGNANLRNSTRPYNTQGDFLISNVVPGSYVLVANQFDGGKVLAARMPLEVGHTAVEGLSLQLAPGADLKGKLKVEGTAADTGTFRVAVTTRGASFGGMGPGAQGGTLKADGTFTLSNLQPELYDLRISGVPEGGYVKAIRLGDADVTDTGLDFTAGVTAAEITIVVNMSAAQVEGTVQNDKSEPAAGASVVLVPDGARRENDRYYAMSAADATGHFTLKGIAPGEYRVYAFDNVQNSAYMDPEWMQPYESKGERVSAKEGGRDSLQLKLILTQGT